MAEMSVRMTLTLADVASPGLRAFMALIDQLGPKVTGLSNRLNTLEGSLGRVGSRANTTARDFGNLDGATARADASIGRFSGQVQASEPILRSFGLHLRQMQIVLSGFTNAMNGLATSLASATTQINAATQGLAGANNQIGTMTSRVHSLTHSLQGLAEAWAAAKIFQAGKASVNEASEFQQLEARIKALNLPAAETNQIMGAARRDSQQLQFVSINQALEARIGAIAGLGHNDPRMIDKTLPEALRVAAILRMRGDKSEIHDLVRNLYGMTEARGQTSDPFGMIQTFNLMQQNATATGMKLTTKDVEAVFRQLKYGGGFSVSDEGMLNILAFANQLKASGHGGGGSGGQGVTQAGTAATQVIKWATGGITNKETARLLTAMGIMDPRMIRDDSDTTQVNIAAGALKGSNQAIRDPIGWIMTMAPIFLAFVRNNPKLFYPEGKDPQDKDATHEALIRLMVMLTGGQGGVNVGNMLAVGVLPQSAARIQEETKLALGSKDIAGAFTDVDATYKMTLQRFEASVKTLEQALGEKLLPLLTGIVDKLAEFVRYLNEIAEANPTATTITVIAVAIGGVALALSGLNRLFGIFAAFSALWARLNTAVTLFGGAVTGAAAAPGVLATAITRAVAVISAVVGRLVPFAVAFLVGWDVGTIISRLEVGGSTVHEWAVQFMNRIVTAFANGWARVRAFLFLITNAERDKEIAENNAKAGIVADTQVHTSGVPVKGSITRSGPLRVGELQDIINAEKSLRGQMLGDKKFEDYSEAERSAIVQVKAASMRGRGLSVSVDAKDVNKETPEERVRREMEEKSKGIETGPYDPFDKGNKRVYNAPAGQARQDYREAMNQMQNTRRTLDAEYAATKISVDQYFDRRMFNVISGYGAAIEDLEAQLAALKSPPKGKAVDQAAVDRVEADLNMRKSDRERELVEVDAAKERESLELKTRGEAIDRRREAIGGRRHEAELMRLRDLTQKERQYFEVNGDMARVKAIDESAAMAEAGIKFDQHYTKLKAQLDERKNAEQEIAGQVKAGTMTQLEAETAIYESRRQSGFQIQEIIGLLKELAEASGDEKLKDRVNDLATQSRTAIRSLSPEVLQVKNVLQNGLEEFFNGFANRTKGIKALFWDLINNITKGLTQLASKDLSEKIGNAIFGGRTGSVSGAGGILSWLFGANRGGGAGTAGQMFWDEGGNMVSEGGGGGIGSFFGGIGKFFSNLFSFETGIDRVPGEMIAKLHPNEAVLNRREAAEWRMSKLAGAGGGDYMQNQFDFHFAAPTSRETQDQLASRVIDAMSHARRNK